MDFLGLLTHNLATLTRLEHGDRLFTQGTRFDVKQAGVSSSAVRWWTGEARWLNVESVKFTFGAGVAVLSLCDAADPHALVPDRDMVTATLERELRSASQGLRRLALTYRDDFATSLQLSSLADHTLAFLDRRAGAVEGAPAALDRRTGGDEPDAGRASLVGKRHQSNEGRD